MKNVIKSLKTRFFEQSSQRQKPRQARRLPLEFVSLCVSYKLAENPDYVEKGKRPTKEGYNTILLAKEYADGKVHVVEAIQNNNILRVHTAYIWDKTKAGKKNLVPEFPTTVSDGTGSDQRSAFPTSQKRVPKEPSSINKYTKNSGNKQDESQKNTPKVSKMKPCNDIREQKFIEHYAEHNSAKEAD